MLPMRPMPSRSRFRIRCVNRTGHSAVHQKIRFIGGLNSDGSAWKLSQEMAVDSMENEKCQLYLVVGRQPVLVIVAASHHGHKYLKAETDPEEPTSLAQFTRVSFLDSVTLGIRYRLRIKLAS
jgi:Protein of unknown function (DUF3892)